MIIIYLILVFLIIGTYFVDSIFFGGITAFSVKETYSEDNDKLKDSNEIEVPEKETVYGNGITGNVIKVSNIKAINNTKNNLDTESSGSKNQVEVSVEVIG